MLQAVPKRFKLFLKNIYFFFYLNDAEEREKLILIGDSGLFDLEYYNSQLKFSFLTQCGAITHYLKKGYKLSVNPNPYFDTKYYLDSNPDVRQNNKNPLYHFLVNGHKEDRNPNMEFNTQLYILLHKDELQTRKLNPLFHFIQHNPVGKTFGNNATPKEALANGKNKPSAPNLIESIKNKNKRSGIPRLLELGFEFTPAEAFDEEYYLELNPDLIHPDIIPFQHYMTQGWKENRNPNAWFDIPYYLETYKDVKDLELEPLTHYLLVGKEQGRTFKKVEHGNVQAYFEFLNVQNQKREPGMTTDYVEFEEHVALPIDLRLIAFYLPQYHPIPENDKAWGKGFTEWTNVSKALAQFGGHYQPRLPGELGYYDLRLIDIQRRQIELAKNYGLHGFCYHYYWFGGQKVIDRPLQQILDNKDLDFPFCINWANENWTRRWDGLDQEVILKQNHSPEDDLAFLEEIKPILLDKRYIRVNGKPLLMIYRPTLFPDIKETVARWRKHAQKIGIGNIYLVLAHSFDKQDPREIGFDAATEFAPNNFNVKDVTHTLSLFNSKYSGRVYDYKSAINYSVDYKEPTYTKFRGVCPSWDNEARKPGKGSTFVNSTPLLYMKWMEYVCFYTNQHRAGDEKIVFVNAWNEWGEAAYLEPDRKFGYAYLEATYTVLRKFNRDKLKLLFDTQNTQKKSDTAVVLHLYYMDLWDDIKLELDHFKGDVDLYVNVISKASIEEIRKIQNDFPLAKIYTFENRGRDVLPFLKILKIILPLKYKYVCKIHSKKSLHRIDGDNWRNHLIRSLIGSPERIKEATARLDDNVGVLVARGNLFSYKEWMGSNSEMINRFAEKTKLQVPDDFTFPAGSMFWCKPAVFSKLLQGMDESDFILEEGQLDGTIAHACERIVGLLCISEKLKIEEI